jgi:hypothetical protein
LALHGLIWFAAFVAALVFLYPMDNADYRFGQSVCKVGDCAHIVVEDELVGDYLYQHLERPRLLLATMIFAAPVAGCCYLVWIAGNLVWAFRARRSLRRLNGEG